MLQHTGLSRTDFQPIGTLIANSALITGEEPTFNLGPFTDQLGPLVFANRDIFPNEVDSLLWEPRGLIFRVANYDILDEFGRNFAFASQTARDRTAGLTIDYGDGTVDRFLVATAGAFDVDNIVGGGFVGGFDSNNGEPLGLPLDFILQDTLNLTKNASIPDAIDRKALMPLPILLAHRLIKRLDDVRREQVLPGLRPDGKCQVTVEYEDGKPTRTSTIVLRAQHDESVCMNGGDGDLRNDAKHRIEQEVTREGLPREMMHSASRLKMLDEDEKTEVLAHLGPSTAQAHAA